jgi:hypothetical protein
MKYIRFARLSSGRPDGGSVANTHAAITTACTTTLSVALVATGAVLAYEAAHKRIILPPFSAMREPRRDYDKYRSRSSPTWWRSCPAMM